MKTLIERVGRKILLIGFCIFASHLFAASIESGYIHFASSIASGTFTLSGSGFSATGGFSETFWGPVVCTPCQPPVSLSVNGQVTRGSFGPDWGNSQAAGPSIFNVTGPPITVTGPGTYTSTFSFTGSLYGTTFGEAPVTVNLPELTGSGQVSVNIVGIPGYPQFPNLVSYTDATYTFTPEPSGMVLVASAVVLIFLARRRISVKIPAPVCP